MGFERQRTQASRRSGATLAWVAVGCVLAAGTCAAAQDQRSGVSVAQPVLSDSPDAVQTKPSAAIPISTPSQAAAPTSAPVVYGPYVPYGSAGQAETVTTPAPVSAFDPDANIVTDETLERRRPLVPEGAASANDPDAGIVTHVPTRPGEINDGTLIRARLGETLSTVTTQPGSRFTAEVSEPVMQDGRVYIPAGSTVEGRVTMVSGGRRIGGRAAIHLEPERVTLPDGTRYAVHARVIDTSSWQNTTVDEEGTIIRRDNLKGTLEAGGLVTGGAIAAGAVIAGPPGALVGAGVGVGATAIVWFKQDRQAKLPKDLGVIFSLTEPLSVTPARAALPSTTPTAGGE